MSSWLVGPNNVWPDAELLVRNWLNSNLGGVNVRTELDSTFGTSAPNASMALPLVLVERVPGGSLDGNFVTDTAAVDISCFAADRAGMWSLYKNVHVWMLRLIGQVTDYGVADDVVVSNGVGEINYQNPTVKRAVVTYRVETRAFQQVF